ncbi:MAG: CoA transferase [Chloroflexi bacterium]|nr:CoA transferase [Chloroflexota bacterium]
MEKKETLLGGCRVLDLTNELGLLAGKVLGDFGADVIKIEKPGGDPSRNIGPFYKDIPDPEKSLFWFATNTSKRGITLNIENHEGRELFRRLVKTADIVLESFEPGYLNNLGIGYSDLKAVKPEIIMTSITPFGQTGPYAHYRATDLIGAAMGGMVRILGELGRPPVRMSCDPQAYFHAALHGALGSVMAYYHQQLTGEGQHVDVSMQDSVELTLMNALEIAELMKVNVIGTGQVSISVRPPPLGILMGRVVFPCKDGYAIVTVGGGAFVGMAKSSAILVRWANEEGMCLEFKDFDFSQWDMSKITQDETDRKDRTIGEFIKTKTKAELMEGAVQRGIMLAPCNTIDDLINSPHLHERNYWEAVEHPELGESITYHGAPIKISDAPWRISRRAPLIGEHNREIFESELGLSLEQMGVLKANGVI